MNIKEQISKLNQYFKTHATKNLVWRKQQLINIKKLVVENETSLLEALYQDLGKPNLEGWITEISYISGDVDHTIKHLKSWSAKKKVSTPLVVQPGKSYIKPEPQGTILIIGAWNYPIQLIFAPLVAAISAGNCAIIKPSELAPKTSNLIATLVPQYLDTSAVTVVEGGVEETTQLLKEKFDHIMYTGNGAVARIVMKAASDYLTPVTLELGGKSPVYIDNSANIAITAQRIAWGKWLNAGQTCIAPDYILTTKSLVQPLINSFKEVIDAMFGLDVKESKSYGRIVNTRHAQRLVGYLENQNIVAGGDYDIENKFMEPTIVLIEDISSPVMKEEIFGPILPIVVVDDFEQAKNFVIENDKPLAAYLFTKNKTQEKQWINEIQAGNQCINDVIMFNAVPDLPFGGTGASGIGQYSGKSGFDNFSHAKPVLKRPFLKDLPVRFAPYTDWKFKILRFLR
jgi:aldehyde dehydrogenase (NAD+)